MPDLGIVLRINAIALEANLALFRLFQKVRTRSRVDFPEPLDPIKAITSPWLAVKSTPLRTSRFPKLCECFEFNNRTGHGSRPNRLRPCLQKNKSSG